MATDSRSSLALGREAYVFTYPLVMNYRTMYMQAIKGDRSFGKRLHLGLSSPAGITRVVRGESDLLGTLTQVIGSETDLPRVKEIQRSYGLQPLSKFLGTAAPAAAPAIQWPAWNDGDETREAYWSYVSFLLPFITPRPDDAPMYEKLASIGLKAGAPWQPDKLDPAVRAALQQGLEDAPRRHEEAQRSGC